MRHTQRGFNIEEFDDANGEKCSLQKSSMATEDCIWLGVDNAEIFIIDKDRPGKYVILAKNEQFQSFGRMLLNQKQVKALLPYLERFVKTGELQ